jgi:hypothetical protein
VAAGLRDDAGGDGDVPADPLMGELEVVGDRVAVRTGHEGRVEVDVGPAAGGDEQAERCGEEAGGGQRDDPPAYRSELDPLGPHLVAEAVATHQAGHRGCRSACANVTASRVSSM